MNDPEGQVPDTYIRTATLQNKRLISTISFTPKVSSSTSDIAFGFDLKQTDPNHFIFNGSGLKTPQNIKR